MALPHDMAMKMWVHRTTVKEIVAIQKDNPHGIADAMYECMGAFLLFGAIELWLNGEHDKARAMFGKVHVDRFTDTEMLLRIQARIRTGYHQNNPFTDTCVAAHQQLRDWQHLVDGCNEEKLQRIKARHAMYRQCQREYQPKEEAA